MDLNQLLFQRKFIIKQLDRILQYESSDLIEEFDASYGDLDLIRSQFDEVQTKIESHLISQKLFNESEQEEIRDSFMDKLIDIRAKYSKFMKRKSIIERNDSDMNSEHKFGCGKCSAPSTSVRLPKLPLLTFSGEYSEWNSYHDFFNSTIIDNNCLSDIQRFQYLRGSLKGEAYNLIKCLSLTSDNFSVAWNSLVERYSDKRRIANKYMDELLNLISLRSDTDIEGMKRLRNNLVENLGALKALGFPTGEWSFLLLHLVLKKLDNDSRRRFELSLENDREYPTYVQLLEFLDKQIRACEVSNHVIMRKSVNVKSTSGNKYVSSFATRVTNNNECVLCNNNHELYKCPKFLCLRPYDRVSVVKRNRLCFLCLSGKHVASKCQSNLKCDKCNMSHNKLLHFRQDFVSERDNSRVRDCDSGVRRVSGECVNASGEQTVVSLNGSVCASSGTVLLSTALVRVRRGDGSCESARVLLDPGSQSSFVTSSFVRRLGIPFRRVCVPVCGLGMSNVCKANGVVSCEILPANSDDNSQTVSCLVLNKITNFIPNVYVPCEQWDHLNKLNLADSKFNIPSGVDILLGAEVFPHIIRDGRVVGECGAPSALNSVFGWLVMGEVKNKILKNLQQVSLSNFISDERLDSILKMFWEIESEPFTVSSLSIEEKRCEDIFVSGHSRDKNGRYEVKLPFKGDRPELGDTRDIALRRLFALERRLAKNVTLKKAYCEFMRDYLDSRHMELVGDCEDVNYKPNYIPHHCVIRECSSTTKLRVVFDGSAKSSNGVSINECLLVGPRLQNDIESILLKFRLHEVGFIADIKQMFRGILVNSNDRDYQRILWRDSSSESVREYRLKTVTYGLSCSPYLAIRTLQQLASDEGDRYPHAAKALVSDIFVDDIVSGAADLESALRLKDELIALCARGCFELRKWASNNTSLLYDIPNRDKEPSVSFITAQDESVIKVLGVQWNPHSDVFQYSVKLESCECTKRAVLSQIAKCYDPLGWLCPVTLFSKCLMQQLWMRGLSWDEPLPDDLKDMWLQYITEFKILSDVKINRFISTNATSIELHGFSDSSERGYAGVVYLRVTDANSRNKIYLLMSKSRVAPLKRISLPRLELCAAVLLSRLMKYVVSVFDDKLQINRIFAWTDSTIALSWIKGSSHEYKTFVANRVNECQGNVAPENWYHISSVHNPADCASRGLLPSQLVSYDLWWRGPQWLRLSQDQWPMSVKGDMCDDESEVINSEKRVIKAFACVRNDCDLFVKYSDLSKLVRVMAWCLRFKNNCLNSKRFDYNYVTVCEYNVALLCLIKLVQKSEFSDVFKCLSKNVPCATGIQRLKPFVDECGLLRVGGRLSNSSLPFDVKSQIILPKRHPLTTLIIDYYHKIYLHVGVQTLQYLLLQKYWILSARSIVRQRVFQCIICFRNKPKVVEPIMGNLPIFRVDKCRAFLRVGIDYCGHFMIKLGAHRNAKLYKAYVCLFVCTVTRAVHLELVSELTAEAFIAALKRFCSRRGVCTDVYCDCGRNFVKANKILSEFCELCESNEFKGKVSKECLKQNINFHFNPPYSPHMGGLWEIQVRCFKHHLKRVIGQQILTYEEFYTVVSQIEAVLNSRPICPLSSDPSDPQALTPGHFIIGQPLVAIPEPDVTNEKMNRLTRWQLISSIVQHYWQRWSKEYLHTLQQRSKWTESRNNVRVGSVVVLKEDNLPPLQWRLGVIEETHPGKDGIIRVVSVRTAQGVSKRAVVKVCPLPDN